MRAPQQRTMRTGSSGPPRRGRPVSPASGGAREQSPKRIGLRRARLRHDVAVVAAELRRMRRAGLVGPAGTGQAVRVGD